MEAFCWEFQQCHFNGVFIHKLFLRQSHSSPESTDMLAQEDFKHLRLKTAMSDARFFEKLAFVWHERLESGSGTGDRAQFESSHCQRIPSAVDEFVAVQGIKEPQLSTLSIASG